MSLIGLFGSSGITSCENVCLYRISSSSEHQLNSALFTYAMSFNSENPVIGSSAKWHTGTSGTSPTGCSPSSVLNAFLSPPALSTS